MLKLTSSGQLIEHYRVYSDHMDTRPRIGLTMRLDLSSRRFYLGRDYSDAILAFGGDPIMIPLLPDKHYIRSVFTGLDGILLPGSDSDIDPYLYGQEPKPGLKTVVPEKDETDLLILEELENSHQAILAICFGMQALNVSRGGTLIQDISSEINDCIKHDQGNPGDRNSHGIRTTETCFLFDDESISKRGNEIRVNSHHHQSVDKVGANLEAVAWASDGVIECIQDTRSDRFVIGVQWHPELSWQKDPLSERVFKLFVAECKTRAEKTR